MLVTEEGCASPSHHANHHIWRREWTGPCQPEVTQENKAKATWRGSDVRIGRASADWTGLLLAETHSVPFVLDRLHVLVAMAPCKSNRCIAHTFHIKDPMQRQEVPAAELCNVLRFELIRFFGLQDFS